MIVSDVTDLQIVTVMDRGLPNKECIAIQAINPVNLGQYGIMLGGYSQHRSAVPYIDHLFWFGDGIVNAGDWLFVYTGTGTATKSKTVDHRNDVFSLYWGKRTTVFADSIVVPILFKVDAVDVLEPPDNQPQLPQPPS